MTELAPYGAWASPISAELLTRGQVGLQAPCLHRSGAYWLEARPEEAGRTVLVRAGEHGVAELTPAPFNVRTRVHEYGGGAYVVGDDVVLAVNFADQRLYRLSPDAPPQALTPASDRRLRYADCALDPARGRVIAVREDHRAAGEPANELVAISLTGSADDPGRLLASGHDFVSAPAVSPDGRQLAWLAWDHPSMPWDGTGLWLADIAADGSLGAPRLVAGGPAESLVQPGWSPDGSLFVVSDRSGWWNLHRVTPAGLTPVCPMAAEFAGPAWSFGARSYGFLSASTLVVAYTDGSEGRLARLDVGSGRLTPLTLPYADFANLTVAAGRILVRAAAPDRPSAILLIDPATGGHEVLREAGAMPVGQDQLSLPQAIDFPSEDGATAHAFYYPPRNPACAAPAGTRPPLIVKSHGGPTGRSSSALDLSVQFWTSRGFALCDVNYGGSTGYGRAYRARLDGRWGEVDVLDCIAAARHLVAAGLAEPAQLAITGGSAGGFTTLAALTFHDVFKAGASHYGVSDLEALARDTHKFESRYLDRLIGPYPARAELYRARSPIHHVDRLACPIIFFQGLEDAVVPPNQAEMMVAALRRKGLPVAYLTFAGEQHGFRQAATIQTVRLAELTFYGRVFGFAPPDALPDLAIENLP